MQLYHDIINFLTLILHNPVQLIHAAGYLGLAAIVFAETGLLVGFFFPGDSLLIAAGLYAATGEMHLLPLLVIVTLAAIAGNTTGFGIGSKLGPMLFHKDDSLFFRKKHIHQAQQFYAKHGGKTIIISCFIPIIRTFVPTVAGAANMNYFRFLAFNIIGAFVWVWSMVLAGYYLGRAFGDKITEYVHFIILGVVLISLLPLIFQWWQSKKEKK